MIIEHPCTTCGYSLDKGAKLVALADIILGSLTIITCSTLLAFFDDLTKETNNCTKIVRGKGVNRKVRSLETLNIDNNDTLVNLVNATETEEPALVEIVSTEAPNPDSTTPLANSSSPKKNTASHICRFIKIDYTFEWVVLITILVFSVIQLLTVKLLLYGVKKKSISALYIWLIIAGFSIPATGFLIKMYEMIVVFAYSEEIRGHKVSHLLEEFKKMPYYCNIQQQLYPRPYIGPKGKKIEKKAKKYKEPKVKTRASSSLSIDEQTNRFSNRQGSAAHFHNKSFLINVPGSVFSVVQFT